MKLNQMTLRANEDFSYSIFGWGITTPPPSPSGNGDFAQPPPPVFLDSANSQMIPPQAIDFTTPNPSSTQYLSMPDSGGGFKPNPGGGYWLFKEGGAYADFTLELSTPTAVNFILTIAAATVDTKLNCPISIYVNNKQVVHRYSETNVNWHPQTFALESAWLQAGANTITVRMSEEASSPLWLQSVGVSTEAVQVTAEYMWSQVGSGQINPGDTFKRTIAVQTGDTSSQTDSFSFAEAISAEVSVTGSDFFEGVSSKLTTTFTASQSESHTITITDLQTSTYEVDITPVGNNDVTFQIWQLALQYEASETRLIQNIGPDDGPIIVTQYPPP